VPGAGVNARAVTGWLALLLIAAHIFLSVTG
jgi:hypothetical protein